MKRREALINQIKKEHERVQKDIDKRKTMDGPIAQTPPNSTESSQNSSSYKVERIRTMQKREIEQLITNELIYEQTRRDEEELQRKRDERMHQMTIEIKQKRKAQTEKRSNHNKNC